MTTMNISLPDTLKSFVDAQVEDAVVAASRRHHTIFGYSMTKDHTQEVQNTMCLQQRPTTKATTTQLRAMHSKLTVISSMGCNTLKLR